MKKFSNAITVSALTLIVSAPHAAASEAVCSSAKNVPVVRQLLNDAQALYERESRLHSERADVELTLASTRSSLEPKQIAAMEKILETSRRVGDELRAEAFRKVLAAKLLGGHELAPADREVAFAWLKENLPSAIDEARVSKVVSQPSPANPGAPSPSEIPNSKSQASAQ